MKHTLAALLFSAALCPFARAAEVPTPGSPGVGDSLHPYLGNGGYTVERYWLGMRFADDLVIYSATTTINARATHALSQFNLDAKDLFVTSARVNGREASYGRMGEELIITPDQPIARGAAFSVRVEVRGETVDTTKLPKGTFPLGLVRVGNWVQAVGQPSNAHSYAAFDDHPTKKAPATVVIAAPARFNSISNGELVATWTKDGITTRTFQNTRKIATELLQIGVGPFTLVERAGPHGLMLRYALPSDKAEELAPQLKVVPETIALLEKQLGPLPLRTYGFYVTPIGGNLETQSLTLFSTRELSAKALKSGDLGLLTRHEMAHEWFGNSVSPRSWNDLWLSEGHATYYEEDFWSDAKPGDAGLKRLRRIYERLNGQLAKHGPIAAPRRDTFDNQNLVPFSGLVYQGGALALYALRQEIGDANFNRLERAWVKEHYDSVAGTSDYIALASRISKRDMKPFLRAWLYGDKVPPMPNHPNWEAAPAKRDTSNDKAG